MRLRLLRWVWTRRSRHLINALFAIWLGCELLRALRPGWWPLYWAAILTAAYLVRVIERRADLPRRRAPAADQLRSALLDGVYFQPPVGYGYGRTGDAFVNLDDQLAAVRRVVAGQPVEGDRCPTS